MAIGSIMAEADLNIDKFMAAVGTLEGGCQGIADAMARVGEAADLAAARVDAFGLAGAQLASAYAEGIASGAALAASEASGMAQGALGAAQGGASGANGVGRMISAGVASGIRSGQSSVVSAAVAMVQSAIRAANATAQIHSPSKVTAKMGRFWDEGWAEGIERNTRTVTGAASAMVGKVADITGGMGAAMAPDIERTVRAAVRLEPPVGAAGAAVRTAETVRTAGQAIDYDRLADAMNRRQVALYMNDRRVAQVMALENARAQSARNRSIALGYGR